MAFENLKAFVAETFPAIQTQITEKQYEQIAWIDQSFHTNAPIVAPNSASNIIDHQKRIFARLYFLTLLRSGAARDYQAFIASQPEPRLSVENFNTTSAFIKKLTNSQYEQLWVATTISKSVHANELAKGLMKPPFTPPIDSVEFLALVMSRYQGLYPAALELINKDEFAIDGFEVMFNSGHFRHMLHVEDGIKMFDKLKAKIVDGEFNQDKLNLWFSYWLIAVVGFSGYTREKGSLNFTNNTFKAVYALKGHLDLYLEANTHYPILQNYLKDRGEWVGFKEKHLNISAFTPSPELNGVLLLVVSRLAAMLNLFSLSKSESNAIKISLGLLKVKIGAEKYKQILEIFNPLVENVEPAVTYAPVFFEKLKNAVGLADAVSAGLLIYSNAVLQYRELRQQNLINLSIPLNLNNLGSEKVIAAIADAIRLKQNYENIIIDPATGAASYVASVLEYDNKKSMPKKTSHVSNSMTFYSPVQARRNSDEKVMPNSDTKAPSLTN